MKPERVLSAILFADVRGYSKLNDHQLPLFATVVLPKTAAVLQSHAPAYVNTWGDAIVAAFRDPLEAARTALELRDLFRNTNWPERHLPADLNVRLALHAGVLFLGDDPVRGGPGLLGTQVNLAARIEPITKAGQVWATDQFVSLLTQCVDATIECDDLGERPLAKQWGSAHLFRVRRRTDGPEPTDDAEEQHATPFDPVDSAIAVFRHSSSDKQRALALELLGQTHDSRCLPFLLEALKNKDAPASLRNRAALSLGELGITSAVPDLIDLVEDQTDDPDVRDTVVEALSALADARAGDTLLKIAVGATSLPVPCRAKAIVALGKLREPRFVEPLIRLLADPTPEALLHNAIVIAFGRFRDVRSVPTLLMLARDREHLPETLRGAALSYAVLIAPEFVVDDLIAITRDAAELDGIKSVAMQGLARVRTTRAVERLQEIGSDPSDPRAVLALALLLNPGKYLKSDSDTDD